MSFPVMWSTPPHPLALLFFLSSMMFPELWCGVIEMVFLFVSLSKTIPSEVDVVCFDKFSYFVVFCAFFLYCSLRKLYVYLLGNNLPRTASTSEASWGTDFKRNVSDDSIYFWYNNTQIIRKFLLIQATLQLASLYTH